MIFDKKKYCKFILERGYKLIDSLNLLKSMPFLKNILFFLKQGQKTRQIGHYLTKLNKNKTC